MKLLFFIALFFCYPLTGTIVSYKVTYGSEQARQHPLLASFIKGVQWGGPSYHSFLIVHSCRSHANSRSLLECSWYDTKVMLALLTIHGILFGTLPYLLEKTCLAVQARKILRKLRSLSFTRR